MATFRSLKTSRNRVVWTVIDRKSGLFWAQLKSTVIGDYRHIVGNSYVCCGHLESFDPALHSYMPDPNYHEEISDADEWMFGLGGGSVILTKHDFLLEVDEMIRYNRKHDPSFPSYTG